MITSHFMYLDSPISEVFPTQVPAITIVHCAHPITCAEKCDLTGIPKKVVLSNGKPVDIVTELKKLRYLQA
jgi:hypothetical protein